MLVERPVRADEAEADLPDLPSIVDDDGNDLDLQNVKGPPAGKPFRHGRSRRFARLRLPRQPPPRLVVRQPRVIVFPERLTDQPPTTERESRDTGRARGGLLVTGGGTRYFGLVPDGGVMPGARLQLAAPLPTLPGGGSGSRWLSSGTVGLSGGFDAGTSGGVDAQLWHAGLVLAMGAPWTRDFIGVALEGGVLGGHYWDGNDVAYSQVRQGTVQGPHGEGNDPRAYGLARLTLQIPLANDVRPFVAGDLGMTERTGDRLAGIAGIHAGVVWNAW
jgi:hypothetical protein